MKKIFVFLFLLLPFISFSQNPTKKAFERLKFYFNDLPLHKPFVEIREYVLKNPAMFPVSKKDTCYLKVAIDKYDRLNSVFYESQIVLRCDSDTALLTLNRMIVTSYYSNVLASKKEYGRLVAEFTELLGKPEEHKYGSKGNTTGKDADFYSADKSLHVTIFWGNKEGDDKYRVSVIYYK